MSLIGILLLVFFIYFIVLPIARVFMTLSKARKHVRDMFSGMDPNGGGTRAGGQDRQSRQYTRQSRPKAKKIDPNVGEYVEFEEVACTVTPDQAECTRASFKAESQIEDADWEDLK